MNITPPSKPLLPYKKTIALIAAMAKKQVIGQKGKLPWHFPEDLRHFRRLTLGHTVIMGRKTFESIGKPLPKRENIVISSQIWEKEGLTIVRSVEEALAVAQSKTVFIIGGEMIFKATLPLADYIYLTQIDHHFAGDTYFPDFDRQDWRIEETRQSLDEATGIPLQFLTLSRSAHASIENR